MKRSHLILLVSSAFLLTGCATVLGWFGYSPQDMADTQGAVKRGAEAGADIMETGLELAKLALIYFGGMLTVPGGKMGVRGAKGVAKMAGKVLKRKPSPEGKPNP